MFFPVADPLSGAQRKRHPEPSPPHKRSRKDEVARPKQKTMRQDDDFASRIIQEQEEAQNILLDAIGRLRPSRSHAYHDAYSDDFSFDSST